MTNQNEPNYLNLLHSLHAIVAWITLYARGLGRPGQGKG